LGKRLEYAFIQISEILNRLFKSGYDSIVYRSILEKFHSKDEVRIHLKEYNSSRKQDKLELLEKAAKHLERKGLDKYRNYYSHEILCEEIAETVKARKWFNYIFGHTDSEEKLYPLIKKYLKGQYTKVFETYDKKGEKWPDFFAIKKKLLGGRELVAVEAKAKFSEYKRFLNQSRIFMRYSDYVFLAATPGFVVEVGHKVRGKSAYGVSILQEDLGKDGIGLLVVDMTSKNVNSYFDISESELLDEEEKKKCLRKLSVK